MLLGRHPDGVPAKHRCRRIFPLQGGGAALHRRGAPRRRRHQQHRRRRDRGRLRRRRPARRRADVSVDTARRRALYRNKGDGTFEDRTEAGRARRAARRPERQPDRLQQRRRARPVHPCAAAGRSPMRNSLLRNNGDGTFTDVTQAAGSLERRHATHSAAWADYDNDGWLDLFVGHELAPSRLLPQQRRRHVRGRRRRGRRRPTSAFTKGVAWGDYDNDGYPDLYVSNMSASNFLYRNNGDGTFTDVAGDAGRRRSRRQLPVLVLRLRQRRLARPLRRRATRTRSRSSSSTTSASRRWPRRLRSTATRRRQASRT